MGTNCAKNYVPFTFLVENWAGKEQTNLLSLSVFSVMRGIQWLVTYENNDRYKHVKGTEKQCFIFWYYLVIYCDMFNWYTKKSCNDSGRSNSPSLLTSCCWQSTQCKSHLPMEKINLLGFYLDSNTSHCAINNALTDLGNLLKQLLICLLCLCWGTINVLK